MKTSVMIPRPTPDEVYKYLENWDRLENYSLQERSLNKLFIHTYPKNILVEDVLIKVCSLNDFYSTNIFSPFIVAKHIIHLDLDERISKKDLSLVNELALVEVKEGNTKNFYSFATKYCSHHDPLNYPIYDSYVDLILKYFRSKDSFLSYKDDEIKNYPIFKDILLGFRDFYQLEQFNLKEIDKYLWQLGKQYFQRKY